MKGYRRKPDKPEGTGGVFELNTFSVLILVPFLAGLFFLLTGLAEGGRVRVAIGVLLLVAAPLVARWAWRGGMWD